MQSRRPKFDRLNDIGQDLVHKCEADTEPVAEKIADLKRDWDDIEARLLQASHQVSDMRQAVSRLDGDLNPLEETCVKVEQGLQESEKFGFDIDAGQEELHRLQVNDVFRISGIV